MENASCPICNREVPLEVINDHIDICLLPGGGNLPDENLSLEKAPDTFVDMQTPGKSINQTLLTLCKPKKKAENDSLPPSKYRKMDSTPKAGLRTNSYVHQHSKVPQKTISCSSVSFPQDGFCSASSSSIPSAGGDQSSLLEDSHAPLAELMRPSSLLDYVGQESVLGKSSILRNIIETGLVPSLIFWGPPGCGKTTLARIISNIAKHKANSRFVQLSATTSGVSDVKDVVKVAKNKKVLSKRKTILFIDEIHRFNKLQQDTFLPHVEDGTIILLGATTENPSFQLNSALLSRCRVIVLEKLQTDNIEHLLRRALEKLKVKEVVNNDSNDSSPTGQVTIESEALVTLAQLSDGDARNALNALQLAIQAKQAQSLQNKALLHESSDKYSDEQKKNLSDMFTCEEVNSTMSSESNSCKESSHPGPTHKYAACEPYPDTLVKLEDIKESLQKTHLVYDRAGEEHYNIISALHKSMRGSNINASLYWLARMLCAGEDPLYVARRLIRFASEDVGLADPNALTQAVAAFQGCQSIGMPECEIILAQAVVYMSHAPKSIEVLSAYSSAKKCVKEHKGPLPSVPLHLRNAPTKLMRSLGYGKGYKYNPAFKEEPVKQDYMPEGMQGVDFFKTA